jgi:3-methyladenine DNA glycosylase/8-oxoguanine DNA glycosylase
MDIALRGAGGEPVDLVRTLASHGTASLPPAVLDEDAWTMEITVPLPSHRPRTVVLSRGSSGGARIDVVGPAPRPAERTSIEQVVRHVLALDLDLSPFYELAARDPDLSWVITGAGRMMRAASVFEDVVKTLCTTNCSWAMTTKMVSALVEHLGEPVPGAPPGSWRARAFPTPQAMAAQPERFYREVIRAGYRAPHLRALASSIAREGDLEGLARPGSLLSDDDVEARLLALPGIGPYGSAHIMLTLGRYSRLILDSWTRPTYQRLRRARRPVSDAGIVRRFRPYGPWAGLAFWCFLTRSWVPERPPPAVSASPGEGREPRRKETP